MTILQTLSFAQKVAKILREKMKVLILNISFNQIPITSIVTTTLFP